MLRPLLTLALAAAPLWWASIAHAQLEDARLETVRAELVSLRSSLDADGLPGAWIADKAREGLAKGAPAARILGACRVLDGQIRGAARVTEALDVPRSPGILRPLVAALAGGYTEAELRSAAPELRRIASLDRAEATRVTAEALAELAERGFDREASLTAVRRGLTERGTAGVRRMMRQARGLRGTASERSRGLSNMGSGARPEHSQGMGPPHDVGFSQGRGRGMSRGMGPTPR